jgi:dipeptidyl aminopeptidase/acylaminoacyl peptidase
MPVRMLLSLLLVLLWAPAAAQAEPGRLIAATPVAGAPAGSRAWRIRYETRDHLDRVTVSTGLLAAPAGTVREPRPVIAWNHGTVGIVEACAPSRAADPFAAIPGLQALLDRGFAVVATDYPGLGTRGPHGYLVGEATGRAVLDGVRAAQAVSGAQAGDRLALWGHSQGGHASLWAAALQPRYAPELRLLGVAAAPRRQTWRAC